MIIYVYIIYKLILYDKGIICFVCWNILLIVFNNIIFTNLNTFHDIPFVGFSNFYYTCSIIFLTQT